MNRREMFAGTAALGALASCSPAVLAHAGSKHVEDFGTVGGADDTSVVQDALDSLSAGEELLFPAIRMKVGELTLPDTPAIRLVGQTSTPRYADDAPWGTVLEALPGADYVAASETWEDNSDTIGKPIGIENMAFDGAGEADNALILHNHGARLDDVACLRALVDGLLYTSKSQNGTSVTGSNVNSKFRRVALHDNGRHGLNVVKASNGAGTDWSLTESFLFANGECGAKIEQSAGADIAGNHLYANGDWDIEAIMSVSFRFLVRSNIFEASGTESFTVNGSNETLRKAVRFANAFVSGYGQPQLAGNHISGIVSHEGRTADAPLVSSDNVFWGDQSGFYLVHDEDCVLLSNNDTFMGDTPFRAANSNAAAKVYADGAFLMDSEKRFSGLCQPDGGVWKCDGVAI